MVTAPASGQRSGKVRLGVRAPVMGREACIPWVAKHKSKKRKAGVSPVSLQSKLGKAGATQVQSGLVWVMANCGSGLILVCILCQVSVRSKQR